MQMGPCQVYGVTLIYLQGEAEIQTIEKKQVPEAGSVKYIPTIFFTDLFLTIQKGM